jgi:hypothetical protein
MMLPAPRPVRVALVLAAALIAVMVGLSWPATALVSSPTSSSPSQLGLAELPPPAVPAAAMASEEGAPGRVQPGPEVHSIGAMSVTHPVVREGTVVFSPNVQRWARENAGQETMQPIRAVLTDWMEVEIEVDRYDMQAEGGVIYGLAANEPGSHVILAHVGEAVAGTVFSPSRGLFRIRHAGDGMHNITQLNPTWSPPCQVLDVAASQDHPRHASGLESRGGRDVLVEPGTSNPSATDALIPFEEFSADGIPPAASDLSTTVDILVAYTPAAKNANGGTAGITALISSAIATANLSYNNSQVGLTLRLAHCTEVSYVESGSLGTDLPRLANTTDGHLDNLPTLRNNYKADLVSLIVDNASDAAGIAYLWSPGYGSGFGPYGYSVVVDAYADAGLTLAHEVGHNLGCGHANGDGGSGAYSYSYGYRFTVGSTQYRTVMAYAPGVRLPYFSNPGVSYQGTSTGNSLANNALTILNSKATIASIQTGSTLYLEWAPHALADLNADGNPDIIWRNTASGRVIVWHMSGTNTVSTASLWTGDPVWTPMTSADLNADGNPDLIWRNASSGRVIVWYMNGANTSATTTAALWTGDPAWVPMAAGDLNADGKTDLIWRNSSSGRVIVWHMNGASASATSTAALWTGDPAWVPMASGDLNADGKTDLIWRNASSGRVIVWYMNGVSTSASGTAVLWTGDPAWIPVAVGEFNSDSKLDILWRNTTSGRVIIWFMDGMTTSATSTRAIWGG